MLDMRFNSSQVGSQLLLLLFLCHPFSVSIPHRQARNTLQEKEQQLSGIGFNSSQVGSQPISFIADFTYSNLFQFLIGRLATTVGTGTLTILPNSFNSSQVGSQRGQTYQKYDSYSSFNSSQVGSQLNELIEKSDTSFVSIPHRQARNLSFLNSLFGYDAVSIPHRQARNPIYLFLREFAWLFQFLIGRLATEVWGFPKRR